MAGLIAGALILCPELYKLGAVRDQLPALSAQIDGMMHIWRLGCPEKLSSVIFFAVRRQPLAWAKTGTLRAIADQRTAQVYTVVSNKSSQKHIQQCSPIRM